MKSLSVRALLFVLLVLGVASSAWAQTDEEHFATFPFNFSNPGARAAGMGGAFIGVANDASSALSNPAGLTNLLRKQIYIEGKGIHQPFAHLELPDSLLSGYGTVGQQNATALTFLNAAIPWTKHNLWFGISYNQFLQYSDRLNYSERRVITYTQSLLPTLTMKDAFNYTGRSIAGTIGYKLAENFRIGGSVSVNRIAGKLEGNRTVPSALTGQIYYPSSKMDSSAWSMGYNVGALYEPVRDTLFFGITYSDIGEATLTETLTGTNPASARSTSRDIVFNVPRRVGFGASWKAMGKRMVIAFDAIHIYYSDLAKKTTVVLFDDAIPVSNSAPSNLTKVVGYAQTSPVSSTGSYTSSSFSIKDGTEFRAGAEVRILSGAKPLFLRYGFFRTPAHNLEYNVGGTRRDPPCDASGNCTGREYADQIIKQVFDITKDAVLGTYDAGSNGLDPKQPTFALGYPDLGWTLGGGWIVGNYQFDVAYTKSGYQRGEFVASAAIRFGK